MGSDADVMIHFDRVAPYLEAALSYADGAYTLDDVRERCADGRLQLWPGPDFAAVTQVMHYPRTRVLHVLLLGGNFETFAQAWPAIAEWGKEQGCTTATALGRKGWQRHTAVRALGWAPSDTILMEATL